MTTFNYLAQTCAVAVVGFVLGYFAGRAARDVHTIASAVTERGSEVERTRRKWRGINSNIVVALVVFTLGILTVVQGLVHGAGIRRIADCHAAYANRLADAIEARSTGSQQAQDALDELMTTFGRLAASPPADAADLARRQEESRTAITNYVAKRAESKAVQRNNPYPPPPREMCAET